MSLISRIIAALKSILHDLRAGVSTISSIVNWMEQVVKYPFTLLGSGNPPMPNFAPQTTKSDIVEDFKLARASLAVRTLDPTGIDTVRKFAQSPQHVRETTDLSAIPADARALLLTLGADELKTLAQAGPGEIRKFLIGKQHSIHGVPVVGVHAPLPANDSLPKEEPLDHRLWKVRSKLLKADQSAEFRISI